MEMKLFYVSRTDIIDYDQYDSYVVCADNEMEAREFHPQSSHAWTTDDNVQCEYIGEAKPELQKGTVCESFNAG